MKEREWDVIVAGAGPQGVAAALAAADGGARTLVLDAASDVGGPLGPGRLGHWRGGDSLTEPDLLRRLSRRAWGRHIVEPEDFALAARESLCQAGVVVMSSCRPVRAKDRGGRMRTLTVATAAGRRKLSAWCFVDATEDWALVRAGGLGPKGSSALRVTLRARIGGIDTRTPGVFDAEALEQYADALRRGQAREEYPPELVFPQLTPCLRGGTALLDATPAGLPVGGGPAGWTQTVERSRQSALAAIAFLKATVPGYENCYLIHFAAEPLVTQAGEPPRRRAWNDSGGTDPDDLPVLRWSDGAGQERLATLGCFLCRGAENLLLARPEGTDIIDAPLRMAAGRVAGQAAALAVLYDGQLGKVDPERLRRTLALREGDGSEEETAE